MYPSGDADLKADRDAKKGIDIGASATYEGMRIFRARLPWDMADTIYLPITDRLFHRIIYT
jgi:hypothetical protein